jgi:diguanylate cyclase (GGDEF)-like protein
MAAAAIALIARVVDLDAPHGSTHLPWIALAAGFALAEIFAFHVQFRGESHSITLNEIVLVVGLFVVSAGTLLAVQLVGVVLALAIVRRQPARKLFFNVAQFALTTAVALAVFQGVEADASPISPRSWFATFAACVAASIVGNTSVAGVIALAERRFAAAAAAKSLSFGLICTVVNTMLGLVVVIVISESIPAGLLLVGPIAVVFVAYRAFLSERSKSEGLQFLYSASEVLSRERNLEGGLVALLDFARNSFHADLAEVVLRGDDEASGFHTMSGPGDQGCPLQALDRALVEIVVDAAGDDAEVLADVPSGLLETRHGLHVGSAMAALVTDEHGIRGAVFVARGRGAAEPFSSEDLRLFETFANQLGTTLEKSRLNNSLAQLQEAKQELAHQAYHDSLTGLANRVLFGERVDEALARARRVNGRVAVLFIDLDDFKTVNDTLGHAAGDTLLIEVARRLSLAIGEQNLAARLGGDEFAVLIAGVTNDAYVRTIADTVLATLATPVTLEGQPVEVRASIGVATHTGATDAAELMQNADVAMYTAKRNGKGRFDEFDPTMSMTVAHRHQMKVGLERAVATDEFVLHYQPVIRTATSELMGMEALIRWQDPQNGMLSPTEFLPVAEETGLIVPIGRFVLIESCRQAAAWSELQPGLRLLVNLSARQLADPDLVSDVVAALAESGLPPEQLQLEVTETTLMHDIEQATAVLESLTSLRVRVAIDDFGIGLSSLSHIRQLPIDTIKIGKPIIDAILESKPDAAFVHGIVELGHVLGLEVVAEGVEHAGQCRLLSEMQCDLVQGYYYAPPMDAAAATRTLASSSALPTAS